MHYIDIKYLTFFSVRKRRVLITVRMHKVYTLFHSILKKTIPSNSINLHFFLYIGQYNLGNLATQRRVLVRENKNIPICAL